MIGKILGGIMGAKAARSSSEIGGPMGAALGVVGASAIKRLSIPALLVMAAGGYAVKKLIDKGNSEPAKPRGKSGAKRKAVT